ncbi:Leucine-binding domain-containing protein [Desulfonema limicola]|uniref:Leucine-binding domain-containing protein n=1 Tax=Desulfonema limicola TaxID=45656 RepID=A0A975GGK8_9BACT|nr:ABC transporter substrate-binding protein [Desulfonema limicola]QTA80445.1 Leucine-binding domain-containing protein [Desulfonema limicola]
MLHRILKSTFIIISLMTLVFSSHVWAEETYKIGGLFSVTGRASFLGDPEKKSMEMVVDMINKNGGIDGRMLEAVIYDTEGDPTKAVMGVSKLINKDQVIAIIGPSTTPTTLAVLPFAEKSKTPIISCAAGNKITTPVNPWVFKTAQSDILAVSAIYEHMKKQNIKNIGILTVSDAFGESGRQQLEEQAASFGLTIVQADKFGGKDTDMTAQLTKIRKAEPDAIVCWGTNPGPAVIAKNIKQLDIKIPLYQSHGVASPKFIELAEEAADGIYLPTGKILVADLLPEDDIQKPVLAEYIKQYNEKYKVPVSGFGGYAYDAVNILAKALKGTGGDKEKLRQNIENMTNHTGVSGTFNFSPSEHNGLAPDAFVMVQIKNGTWELIK